MTVIEFPRSNMPPGHGSSARPGAPSGNDDARHSWHDERARLQLVARLQKTQMRTLLARRPNARRVLASFT